MLAERTRRIEPSGIRRVFELISTMEDPINLSIGQAHFDAPPELVEAACRAMRAGHNRYTVTQGLPELNAKVMDRTEERYGVRPECSLITSGVSGGILVTFMALLDPGDDLLIPDPDFMMYRHSANMCDAAPRYYNLYPDRPGDRFRIDPAEIEELVTEKTKIIFLNSPSNPTGTVLTRAEVKAVCDIANKVGAFVVSDEIYDAFVYGDDYASPVEYAERVIQLGGFSKTYGVPGWRLGWVTGPKYVMDAMKTLQQFSYVCAPAPLQHAALEVGFDLDMSVHIEQYRGKRDLIASGLDPVYKLAPPEGSFYAFPSLPAGVSGATFMEGALAHKLLVVPGKAFSPRDTHFRLSFAAEDRDLHRGIEALNELAKQFGG